ncbi:methyltransferase domain-containing protein [Streptomyces sp. SID8366]|uniref:class I SAM-dependent methyltransferase n=2 Tax=Streptomyces TaxID=1883 RepID=UPI000DBA586D|nr:class I SAM-dependent methyltransferase [Streptomyces sp. PsTaAH-130]MYU07041.1 methyltransferase domain-containing protein [Streptomyces sp. SID8366]RAJ61278.1 methyltransferase family protein [Streptomyces sp. PsTaAH-130]
MSGSVAWAAADPYATALRTGRGPLFLRRADGWLLPLEVERWCGRADLVDLAVLDRCEGSVLDVGCGPGRLVAELAARGRTVLGIDVSDAAVAHTTGLGGPVLRRSVFEVLPGEGRWDTVLLMDGNIGIGGDPAALLGRVAALLRPGGLLIAETAPVDIDERAQVEVVDVTTGLGDMTAGPDDMTAGPDGMTAGPGTRGTPFPWARLGTPALLRHARVAGLRRVAQWGAGGRCFAALRTRHASSAAEPPKSAALISSQRVRKPSGDRPVADR